MIPAFIVCALLSGCSLVNRDLPNEPPKPGLAAIDTLQIRRGGQIGVEVRASDEDDDPLFYAWQAYRLDADLLASIQDLAGGSITTPHQFTGLAGLLQLAEPVGGFLDSTALAQTTWVAPAAIQDTAETFLLVVTVTDRLCETIADPEEYQRCVDAASLFIELFSVTVLQRPPTLSVPNDTTISFDAASVALTAAAEDADDDPVSLTWDQLAGPDISYQVQSLGSGLVRLYAVPLFPGQYEFRATASDGADTTAGQVRVQVVPRYEPPAGGTVALTLPDGSSYEIDVYEYPNERGTYPRLTNSWFEAARLCAERGKRLCTRAEWVNACRGPDGRQYSSLDDRVAFPGPFGLRFCNTSGSDAAPNGGTPSANRAPSGSYPNCTSGTGVFDMTGNLREWLGTPDAQGQMVGGVEQSDVADALPDSCGAVSEFLALPPGFEYTDPDSVGELGSEYSDYLDFDVGFRCCR